MPSDKSRAAHTPNRYWNTDTPPKTKAEFFNAVTTPAPSGDGTVATIRMYGPIDSWGGWWGVSAEDFSKVLDALPDTVSQIVLRINSPGGEVWEGMAILNMLRAHKAKVTAVVDAIAASAASVIAVGCDETVMSPGTQMMIHSPSTYAMGDAVEMRKVADILDTIEASLVEIYTAKAGKKDWTSLLAEETWLTATQAVETGLADRVDVVPDAGVSSTVGEPDPVIVAPDPSEDPENVVPLRFAASGDIARRIAALTSQTPVSTEPGEPIRKENVVAYDDLKAGIATRLGVTDADASDETLLAALDEALDEQPETEEAAPAASLPAGAIVVDQATHEQLQRDAARGRQAMDTIDSQRRDSIIASALADGRIAASAKDGWRAQLDKDETGISALLGTFPKNAVPVTEVGHSDTVTSADDSLYAQAWGTDKEA